MAGNIAALYLMVANLVTSEFGEEPLIGFFAVSTDLVMALFLISTTKALFIAFTASFCVSTFYAFKIQNKLGKALMEEYSYQTTVIIIIGYLSLFSTMGCYYFQRKIELNIWKLAHSNNLMSEALTQEAVQAAKSKDTFISSLSHEIRNPLNLVKGSIDYMLATVEDLKYHTVLKNAKLGCGVLLNLVNNVLDAAKLRSEKMELSFSETDFTHIVSSVLSINSENIEARKMNAQAFIDKDLPPKIWTDPSRIMQVMMNLFSNASKFTEENGKIHLHAIWYPLEIDKNLLLSPIKTSFDNLNIQDPLINDNDRLLNNRREEPDTTNEFKEGDLNYERLNIRSLVGIQKKHLLDLISSTHNNASEAYRVSQISINNHQSQHRVTSNGYLKIQVADSGCGISEDQIPRLFEMFAQARQNVQAIHGGTGLGLWICKQLCQKMGGDIKLYSRVSQGTKFVMYIPVVRDLQQESLIPRLVLDRSKVNVLVVDDLSANRDLHRLLLEREGAQVIVSTSGEEAFSTLTSRNEGYFDFIMMDVLMPRMDGFATAKKMRDWEAENRRKKTDIYFVSGEYVDERDLLASFRSSGGVDSMLGIQCIRKPIDLIMLRTIVQKYKDTLCQNDLPTR